MSEQLILASECDVANEVICVPADVKELFELPFKYGINRTILLTFAAAAIVILLLYVGLRKPRAVPTRFQAAMESLVQFVRNDIATGIIGPEGAKYAPYLLSLFFFILVGNLFEVTPGVNFPITSRMAIPAFLAITTWVIFVVVGFAKHGISYFVDTVWLRSVPFVLRILVAIIELFSVFVLRPLTLAVRLFANLVAGHLMLTLLLSTGVFFALNASEAGLFRVGVLGPVWFVFGLGIFVFEIVVAVLQAYIFTLLAAVYIQSSVQPEH